MKSQWAIPKRTQEIKEILYLPLSLFQLRSKNKSINESKVEKKNRSISAAGVLQGSKCFWSAEVKWKPMTLPKNCLQKIIFKVISGENVLLCNLDHNSFVF